MKNKSGMETKLFVVAMVAELIAVICNRLIELHRAILIEPKCGIRWKEDKYSNPGNRRRSCEEAKGLARRSNDESWRII